MKIAVLGGGHGCYAAAADLSDAGHDVRLWRRDATALQPVQQGGIRLKDQKAPRAVRIALSRRPTSAVGSRSSRPARSRGRSRAA